MLDSMNIALLGNFTLDYIAGAVKEQCRKYGVSAAVYISPYDQCNQEILNTDSGFYASNPQLTMIILEGKTLFPEWYDIITLQDKDEVKESMIKKTAESIISLVERIHSQSSTKVLVNNFIVPYHTPLGILDNRGQMGLKSMITRLNSMLESYASETGYMYVFDFNGLCAYIGHAKAEDKKMNYIAKNPLSNSLTKALAREYMRYILPLTARSRKCLVLDLDNTLWGGVAGEDGFSGIKLDIAGTGRCFYDFQKEILNLYHRGIILAVNSKNNVEDAMNILENHPHMLLRKQYFSCLKINWEDKVTNLKGIAAELNIDIGSLVFFDDSPVEREYVKSALPEVTVVDVPEDTSKYIETLHHIVEFDTLSITSEDRNRNRMYEENRRRLEASQQFISQEEYIASLNSKVSVSPANKFTIPRIAQLTQKTNQFNMTTKRYLVEDIERMVLSDSYTIYSCSVSDRFGDNGIVGCCIIKLEGINACIDTFLLSCRVLGRNIEYAFLGAIVAILRGKGVRSIHANYIETARNKANADFYAKFGFSQIAVGENETLYCFDTASEFRHFEYIEILLNEGGDIIG